MIYIDVQYLQPGDIIRSTVDPNFQVRIERKSLSSTNTRPVHTEPLDEERQAAQDRRKAEREERSWLS